MAIVTAESLAQLFHDNYERLAPEFGYTTRISSAVPWQDVPEPNKSLMIAVAKAVMRELGIEEGDFLPREFFERWRRQQQEGLPEDEREVYWPPPREDPPEEPSHPWARRDGPDFDWDEERERQKREGVEWEESDEEREERERSILP